MNCYFSLIFYVVVKMFMITKNSVMEIRESQSRPVKSNPVKTLLINKEQLFTQFFSLNMLMILW